MTSDGNTLVVVFDYRVSVLDLSGKDMVCKWSKFIDDDFVRVDRDDMFDDLLVDEVRWGPGGCRCVRWMFVVVCVVLSRCLSTFSAHCHRHHIPTRPHTPTHLHLPPLIYVHTVSHTHTQLHGHVIVHCRSAAPRLYDLNSGRRLMQYEKSIGLAINNIVIHKNHVYTGSADKRVIKWTLDGEQVMEFVGHKHAVDYLKGECCFVLRVVSYVLYCVLFVVYCVLCVCVLCHVYVIRLFAWLLVLRWFAVVFAVRVAACGIHCRYYACA